MHNINIFMSFHVKCAETDFQFFRCSAICVVRCSRLSFHFSGHCLLLHSALNALNFVSMSFSPSPRRNLTTQSAVKFVLCNEIRISDKQQNFFISTTSSTETKVKINMGSNDFFISIQFSSRTFPHFFRGLCFERRTRFISIRGTQKYFEPANSSEWKKNYLFRLNCTIIIARDV